MAASISLRTFYRWIDYAARNPFGEGRADLRMGIMTSTLVNMKLARGQRRTRPIDFMPFSKGGTRIRKESEPANKILADLTGIVALHKRHTKRIAEANAKRC